MQNVHATIRLQIPPSNGANLVIKAGVADGIVEFAKWVHGDLGPEFPHVDEEVTNSIFVLVFV